MEQKKNLDSEKIFWIEDIKKINSYPTLYLANEFFDAIPIKQFFKKKEGWVERFVDLENPNEAKFREYKTDINILEKNLNFEISKNHWFNFFLSTTALDLQPLPFITCSLAKTEFSTGSQLT